MAKRTTPTPRRKPAQKRAAPAPKRPAQGSPAVARVTKAPAPQPRPSADDSAAGSITCPVVGIGASAGGLEAFSELLRELPADTGLSFVFIQHLDPKHVSMLTELLTRETVMPVREVSHGMRIEPNHVYVIPRNTLMTISQCVLELIPRPSGPGANMPVDYFFRSLALEQKNRAVGVILAGSASDGTIGLQAIKAAGGITLAQDPQSAKYDGMPRSAVAAGCVDFVLTPQRIARQLARIGRHPYVRPVAGLPDLAPLKDAGNDLSRLLLLLRNSTGVDFTDYKDTTIRRRIFRRMVLHQIDRLDAYVNYVRAHPAEAKLLYEDILINVTEFFRDPATFKALRIVVFPRIMQEKDHKAPIRIWVPGCSTGEEVFSIAMTLIEYLDQHATQVPIQIFGTDISDLALERARAGVYPESISHDVSPERLRRFFTRLDPGFQISKSIREMCVFAKQNMAKDPPFSKLDLISCRNVLIYFGPALQKKVMPIFHYALKPSGFLLLGTSETIGLLGDLFRLVDKKNKIYARKQSFARTPRDFTRPETAMAPSRSPAQQPEGNENDINSEADRLLLSRFVPPAVVIDDDLNIVQSRGHTGPLLDPTGGKASLHTLKMARSGLAIDLRAAIHKARRDEAPVCREGLRVTREGQAREIGFEVIPVARSQSKDRYFLVVFHETGAPLAEAAKHEPGGAQDGKRGQDLRALERKNVELLHDLTATREYLQSLIEEHEAANEELRAANEEIQSSNEELQSTNEELQTAKEELQSTNEELNTVNEELNSRNLQLSQTGNDLYNLLTNVHIPIVMLGNDLRIRRFTPISEKLLNLIPTDVGRRITDIKFNLEIPNLRDLLASVTENLTPRVLDLQDWSGHRYSLRIRPYRTEDNRIDGVVMVLLDLDPARQLYDESPETPYDREVKASSSDAHEVLHAARENLRALTANLLQAQEDERRRISRELHDELNQKLAIMEVNVESLERNLPSKATRIRLGLRAFRKTVGELSDDLRRIAYALHPSSIEDLGVTVALQAYCEEVSRREGMRITFKHQGVPAALPQLVAVSVYRIVQESVRNVVKHSGAKNAAVSLTGRDNVIHMEVKDAGAGFDVLPDPRKGLGLIGMEERARLIGGTLTVKSRPGRGTQVELQVPLEGPHPPSLGSEN